MSEAEKLKLEEFTTKVLSKIDVISKDELEGDNGKIASHDKNWASELSHPCARALTYARLNFDERRDKGADSGFIYRVLSGKIFERDFRHLIEKADVEISKSQTRFTWDVYEISGRVDGMISLARKERPIEIKFVNPRFFDQISDINSIKSHRSYWVRRILTQMNLYQLMSNSEFGFLAIGSPGKRPKLLVNPLDYEIGEDAIKKAEIVNAHVKEKTYPDRIPYSDLCELCDYNALCAPMKFTETEIIDEDELNALVEDWKKLRDSAKKWKKIDEELKKKMKGRDALVGDVEITSTEIESTKYKIPDEIKAEYAEKYKYFRVDINVIGG